MERAVKAYLGLVLIFLYLPIAVMIAMAFNRSALYEMPFTFDLVWFKALSTNERLLQASWNSVWIACVNAVIATTLGTLAAYAFARYEFRAKRLLQILLFPPITIPWLIIGTSMLIFFFWTGIGRGLHAILLGHVALSLPYVIVVVGARFANFGPELEEAAASLGATPWQAFWRVTVPVLLPGITAAALFAFAVSFDQFVISYFLAPPGTSTLPVEIYTSIRKGFTPEINAISSIIILFSMGLMLIVARNYKFGGDNPNAMSRVDIQHVTKRYGTFAALDNVTITFNDGEFFGLLGPSGSGKTTLLRSIAGFIIPDDGSILFDGEQVETVPVHRRAIGMVFQSYALFPHLTIEENIGFGLDVRSTPREDIRKRVGEMLALVRLTGLEARYPRQLSGGQQQRVALARALITRPKVLLLDEPLGALDRRLRQEMQVELKDIQRETGVTSIFVTHDQEEALTLSDRIAIIDQGRLIQVDAPQTVYERPANIFAANFLGDANVFRGMPVETGLKLTDGTLIATLKPSTGAAIVRPEKLRVANGRKKNAGNSLVGEIVQAIYSGASVTYRIRVPVLGETPLLAFIQNQTGEVLETGSTVTVSWDREQTIPVES